MTTPVSLMDDQVVDMVFIIQLSGLIDKWLYGLIRDEAFPAPIKLGRSSCWLKSKVEAWLQACIAQPRPQFLAVIRSPAADVIPGLPAAFCCLLYLP